MSDDLKISDESVDVAASTEFPVVVLGEAGESVAPRVRLLQGRIPESWVLYPLYLTITVGGALAADFALSSEEWSIVPVTLAWAMLYVWYWFYGVAYRYRRRLLKYTSVAFIFGMTWGLSVLCEDRAEAQIVAIEGILREREPIAQLRWAAMVTWAATLGLVAHIVFLGRGYREKREGRT